MNSAVEIAERFAKALDGEEYEVARLLLSEDCTYLCRGELYVGPSAIIASYQYNGDVAESKFDSVAYESSVLGMPDGTALVRFTDHLTLKGKSLTFQCEQVLEVSNVPLVTGIEHRDLPGQREALAAFIDGQPPVG